MLNICFEVVRYGEFAKETCFALDTNIAQIDVVYSYDYNTFTNKGI